VALRRLLVACWRKRKPLTLIFPGKILRLRGGQERNGLGLLTLKRQTFGAILCVLLITNLDDFCHARRQVWNIGPEHRHAWTILDDLPGTTDQKAPLAVPSQPPTSVPHSQRRPRTICPSGPRGWEAPNSDSQEARCLPTAFPLP
jgi:hypothetical protein